MSKCEAVQHSDEMACGRCGLRWDVSDESPPACGKAVEAVAGRVDLSKALAALSRTTESRAGLLHAANGSPTLGIARQATCYPPPLANPERLQTSLYPAPPEFAAIPHDNFDQGEHRSDARRRDDNSRRWGKVTEAEAWMRDAVARGEVVRLKTFDGAVLLKVGPYLMPAEIPAEASIKMGEAALSAHGGYIESMRAAYRELLAYLGQA